MAEAAVVVARGPGAQFEHEDFLSSTKNKVRAPEGTLQWKNTKCTGEGGSTTIMFEK